MCGLQIRFVECHGEIVRDYKTPYGYKTINEHWVVNGHVFYHYPTKEEIESAYNG